MPGAPVRAADGSAGWSSTLTGMASRLPFATVRRRLAPFAPRSGRIVLALLGLTFLGGLAEVGALVLIAQTALAVTRDEPQVPLLGLDLDIGAALLAAFLALLVRLALSILVASLGAGLAARTVRKARQVLLGSYFRANWAKQSQEQLGELQEYLTTAVSHLNNVNMAFVRGLNALVSFSVVMATAVVIDPLAAIGGVAAAALLLLLLRPLTRRTRQATRSQELATRILGTKVTEAVRLGQEVRVFGVRGPVLAELDAAEAAASGPLQRATFAAAIGPAIYSAVALAFLVLGLALLAALDDADLGALGAALLLLLRGLGHGQALQGSIQGLAATVPFLDAVHERKRSYDLHAARTGQLALPGVGRLELHGVRFAYGDGPDVLRGLDLTIDPLASIGIVGPSGSGKSTLLQLLLRLRPPTEGSITIDGKDLWDVAEDAWTDRVAFVPQDARLIAGTVAENIAFFRPLDDLAVERAATLAHIHEDVMSWEAGYATRLGESTISGGQRQRIAIARALAGQPDLLILDEPTSALDLLSEARLQQTLEGLRGRLGLVIVAHRLSTVQQCDRILVLRAGGVEAFDTHERLLEHSTFYREAVRLSLIDQALPAGPAG